MRDFVSALFGHFSEVEQLCFKMLVASRNSAIQCYALLVEGAREHSLPEDYIAELDRIDAVADTDERRDREKRALACHAES
jgi:hypothetical protein